MKEYFDLKPGEIIQTEGAKDSNKGTNDEQWTENGWLDAPSCWNGKPVPDHTAFRRPIIVE